MIAFNIHLQEPIGDSFQTLDWIKGSLVLDARARTFEYYMEKKKIVHQ